MTPGSDEQMRVAEHGPLLTAYSDLRPSWFDRVVPLQILPFLRLMRLDRPIGFWLRLFPAWWAILLSSKGGLQPSLLAIFFGEAVLTRGLGCTVNDIVDRDIDAHVTRTRSRPIASGQVSVQKAVLFLLLQAALGLLLLSALPGAVSALFAATAVLACVYPLMKRITFWPQAFLGVVFNTSALMAWIACSGHISAAGLSLYAGCFFWTLGYDTIYAHQDKVDDARIGVRSTALYLGSASKRWVAVFYALAALLFGAAIYACLSPMAALAAGLVTTAHFAYQLKRWHMDSPQRSLAMFKSNQSLGWLVLAVLLLFRML